MNQSHVVRTYGALLLGVVVAAGAGCRPRVLPRPEAASTVKAQPFSFLTPAPDPLALIADPKTAAERIVNGAKKEVRRGVVYDASYQRLSYPNGDVPADRGACTDVVIRALREAGYDLQKLMHEDMRRRFSAYPQVYGLRRPDRNIDHRRCTNQMVFFRRYGRELPRSLSGAAARSWQAGDLVFVRLPNGLLHTGVCSDVRNAAGLPLVIHNMNRAAQEDVLGQWEILGHFRYPVSTASSRATGRTRR